MRLRFLSLLLLCSAIAGAQTINPNQIRPSSNNGDVFTTVGGAASWAPPSGGFSLTTTGSSGPSTYTGGILNIPNYAGVSDLFGDTTGPAGSNQVTGMHFGTLQTPLSSINPPSASNPILALQAGQIVGIPVPASGCGSGTNCIVNNPTGNQVVTQSAGTQFYSNILNGNYIASQFQTGSLNNGIANAVSAACTGAGCAIDADPSYGQTEIPQGYQRDWVNFLWPSNTSVLDQRGGVMQFSFENPASISPPSIAGVGIRADYTRSPLSTATYGGLVGSSAALNIHTNYFTGLRNTQNTYANGSSIPTTVYGGFHQGFVNTMSKFDSGQQFGTYQQVFAYGAGDAFLTFEQLYADGGVNGIEDEGVKIGDHGAAENPNVYTGTATAAVAVGGTTIATNCTTGCNNEWPGQDRLILDTASGKVITGTFQIGFGAPTGNIPPTVTDPTASYPVSTMVMLCYSGSDNGAAGAAGCPSGGTPSGYIPGNASSPSEEQPNTPIVTGVLPTWSGLPSGFCTSANLQSSNSGAACYMPATGVGCLTDQNYDEHVNYTYNSATQQVTLSNLNFVHSNAMVFSTGGLCGYAVEVAADIYTATGTGGAGVQSQVFPVEGSITSHTLYYMPRRSNEGYGPAILGLTTDQNSIGSGQLSFSTASFGYSLGSDNHTVTFSMNNPANVTASQAIYNQLPLTFSTGNSTYNGTFTVTWQHGNVFTYFLPTTPTGAAPSSGTTSFSNMQYKLYPAATILNAYNPATNKIDGTVTTDPSPIAWASGDGIRVPHYQQMNVSGEHYVMTQFLPGQFLGTNGFDITYNGTALSPGAYGFGVNNNAPSAFYQGYGGTHVIPFEAFSISGLWDDDFAPVNFPDQALFKFSACKPVIGCSASNASFNLFQMPTLPNAVPGFGVDFIAYHPEYQSGNRPIYTGEFLMSPLATWSPGHEVVQQDLTSPSVSTSNLFTTQLTSMTVFINSVGTGGSTTINYWVVGHALSSTLATTAPISTPFTTSNATLNGTNYNLICIPHQAGYASYDILKGTTSLSIATGISATSPNGGSFGQPANYSCFADQGGATSAYTPTANLTGGANIAGLITAPSISLTNLIGNDGCLQSAGGVITSTGTACGSGGGGGISGGVAQALSLYGSATTITAAAHMTDNGSVLAATEPITAPTVGTNGSTQGLMALGVGTGTIATSGLPANYAGFIAPTSGTPQYLVVLPSTAPSSTSVLSVAPPITINGVSQAAASWTSGGGGSLPTATQPGQMYTATAAGTTAAVQPQIFYSQSGDTIASIESECSSACTYYVTSPQTITLAASHALAWNVHLEFAKGGQWTVNGSGFTLTFQSRVDGTLTQHFAGTATLSFGGQQLLTPIEWFGAVGYTTSAAAVAGTDSTSAIQECFSSITFGQCQLQAFFYKTTATLTIGSGTTSQPKVGLRGAQAGYWASTIVSTSASADIIDVIGVSTSNESFGGKFDHFNLARSVAPTGTAAGLSFNYAGGYTVDNVASNDSIRDFYYHAGYSYGVGVTENSSAGWNLSETSGTYYGFYLDSADGNAENSIRFLNDAVGGLASATPTTYGMILTGEDVNDVMTYGFETAGDTYGQVVNYTGSGGNFATSDIHFTKSIHDNCLISCYKITGTTQATDGSVEIDGGWVNSSTSTGKLIDIESSYGVAVRGVMINQHNGFTATNGIYANASDGLIIANNNITGIGTASTSVNPIFLNATTHSTIIGNKIVTPSGTAGNLISFAGSSFNTVTGNTLAGYSSGGYGIFFDATSNNNIGAAANSVDTTNITGGAIGATSGATGNGFQGIVTATNAANTAGGPNTANLIYSTSSNFAELDTWGATTSLVPDFYIVGRNSTEATNDVYMHCIHTTGCTFTDPVIASSSVTAASFKTSGSRKGTFVCTAAGTITISNTNELVTSDVIISLNTAGGTISTAPAMKTVTSGTGFTVLCGASDTSTYNYNILN